MVYFVPKLSTSVLVLFSVRSENLFFFNYVVVVVVV